MKPTRGVVSLFFLGLAAFISLADRRVAADAELAPAPPRAIALTGAMIRTQSDAGDFVGTIVIEDRKITAIEVPSSRYLRMRCGLTSRIASSRRD